MSTGYATVTEAHQALGELDLAGLPTPMTITIQHDYDDYSRLNAVVHVSEGVFDQWFLSIGAEGFTVRYRGVDDEYLEMVAIARNGVEVFCLVKKDSLEAQA